MFFSGLTFLILKLKLRYCILFISQEKKGTASADWSTIYSYYWAFPIWGFSRGWNSTVQRRVSTHCFPFSINVAFSSLVLWNHTVSYAKVKWKKKRKENNYAHGTQKEVIQVVSSDFRHYLCKKRFFCSFLDMFCP